MADIFRKEKKEQLKSKFKKVLNMCYSYSCKEYVVKIS